MEEEQGPNIVSMEGSSPSIDPIFDPLIGLDFEIESNFIENHMMAEEKKDSVMDIVCWKPREEVDLKACSPVPPIANYWFKFRWEEAKEWETLFSTQIEAFKAIIGSDVATAESFDVD
ncbi:hypothetical protein RHMOL_Rhmol08G0286800 [Rhododendron molle]|uniref:Uncharacterized protein n=1 Tax=Rhododendron molle TaxID=49168 RepID=A0ACC0MVL3_RHOML|nr:hypothetical protein RHMOL_Rhmol08G0286800 [Rhododendron molle]